MTNKVIKPELLAPAGSLKKLKIALAYGADAVYIGLPAYSLRAPTAFNLKDIKTGIEYAHQLGKKVYITINIFAHNRHLKLLPAYLKQLKKYRPDAIIVSDPGVLQLVKKILPKVAIHLSTQMNTLNYEAVRFWQEQGVKRIILGREATWADIKEIHRKVPKMALEVFVHGAMCLSYSGRCYLSAWLSKRSAMLGLGTQPCRWNYKIYLEEQLRPGQMMPIEADDQGTYLINSKDLNLIDHLNELIKSGVVLIKIDNRGYTTGFLLGDEASGREEFSTAKAMSDWEFVGEVVGIKKQENNKTKKQIIIIKPHNALKAGEKVEIITPAATYKTKFKEFFDKNHKSVNKIRGGTTDLYSVEISNKYDIVKMSLIRKKKLLK